MVEGVEGVVQPNRELEMGMTIVMLIIGIYFSCLDVEC